MDWALAIDRKREALLRIVAALFAITGLEPGGQVATLPRHLRSHARRLLRPAESAARRLIVMAARDLVVTVGKPKEVASGRPVATGRMSAAARRPAFPVLDPLPKFLCRPIRRRPKGFPRISIIGVTEPRPIPDNWIPAPDDPVNATGVCRRLVALKRALDDLDSHARRLARWRAKRDLGLNCTKRFSPLRPGRPPGHRRRPIHEVDEVLRECHSLAHYAMKAPDTS